MMIMISLVYCMWVVLCIYIMFVIPTVPPPSVSVTNSSGTYHPGTNFNLTCTIELNTAVDTPVVINSTWHRPVVIPAGTRVVASAPTGTGARYQTILMFRPLNTSDSGNYTCEVTVSPSPESQFIISSTAGRDTLSVTVQGEKTLWIHRILLLPIYLSLFSTLALPPPEVVITADGSTTAGDVYTLTCNTTVVENLAVKPDIQWLYNGTTVGGTNITVGAVMMTPTMTGDMFTQNLTFSPLRTSHGGQYICRASVRIWAIFLQGISSQSSLNITIKSKNMRLSAHKCFKLTCTVELLL